ncbi:MAG: SpoIIE family protein phosphatase [Anaerolineales bacterium]
MEVQIAVAKINKYASSESGDTVEVVERPSGGLSVVMADGQSSGRGAKRISNLVVRKVIALLAEGVRDGAAARAASDSLFTEKNGKVSATLNILSVDLQTNTLVVVRNNPAPALLAEGETLQQLDSESLPVGLYRHTRPAIVEHPLQPNLTVAIYTDGIVHAGDRNGERMNAAAVLQDLLLEEDPSPQWLADSLLEHALRLDQNRPLDDMSVVVLRVRAKKQEDLVRRLSVRLPIPAVQRLW